jgi:hypothetical protein
MGMAPNSRSKIILMTSHSKTKNNKGKSRQARPPRQLANRVYPFKRVFQGENLVLNGDNIDTRDLYALSFTFGQLPNYAEFAALFDKYVIDSVDVEFYFPVISQSPGDIGVKFCKIYTVIDYDDSNSPASLDELLEYQTLATTQFNTSRSSHTVHLIPRVARPLYNGVSIIPAYEVAPPRVWIDLASTSVPHYGLKLALEYNNTRELEVQVRTTVTFRCQQVR